MSLQTEQRGFTIGRQVGGCGRCTRLVFGLLGLVYIGTEVLHLGPSALLLERLAGGFISTTALYLALFWLFGERVSHPWLRTVIFWLPAVFILLPGGWGLGYGDPARHLYRSPGSCGGPDGRGSDGCRDRLHV